MNAKSGGKPYLFHATAPRLLKACRVSDDEKWAGTLRGTIRDFIRTEIDRLLAAGGHCYGTRVVACALGIVSGSAGRVSGEVFKTSPGKHRVRRNAALSQENPRSRATRAACVRFATPSFR